MKMHPLQKLIKHHKSDNLKGIYSVCSANPYVVETSISFARQENSYLLIESTSNQVDQYGGYTGMKPEDFKLFVHEKAAKLDFPVERIILGGDHLGPNVWQNEPADTAMEKAAVQVEAYVKAGYSKIHLDTSMPCQDDEKPLSSDHVAGRAAALCRVAEQASTDKNNPLVYIIGSEVPVPGGAQEELDTLAVTNKTDVHEIIQLTEKSFNDLGLQQAWNKVIAVVVQPGVEFSNVTVVPYDASKAQVLSKAITEYPQLCYEAHSTDYQTQNSLTDLVKDHFAILKVGPALTFALREALFAMAYIENELYASARYNEKRSDFFSVIEQVMDENPKYWKKYYAGDDDKENYYRQFGLSDRIRYYWPDQQIQNALQKMFQNLTQTQIPDALLSQFLPEQYRKIKNSEIKKNTHNLIADKIVQVLTDYSGACSAKNNYALLSS